MRLFKRLISTGSKSISPPLSVSPRAFPTTGFTTLLATQKVEEEKWPWYTPKSFYPVRIGDVLHSRYQVLYKLGYGTTSTAWMCRDLARNEHVCMKSLVCDYASVEREIKAYDVLSKTSIELPGKRYVRQALDRFELCHDNDNYRFLIHEPLGIDLTVLLQMVRGKLTADYTKVVIHSLPSALRFLHASSVIHGDIQASNVQFRIDDKTVIKEVEDAEVEHPSPRKIAQQAVVFETRSSWPGPFSRLMGPKSDPILCDLGEARTGQELYEDIIQPAAYRAPEVFLHIPWNNQVDIWNLGCFMWDIMCGQHIFSRTGAPDELSADRQQLAWMVALLGPPPNELLSCSGPNAHKFFAEDGTPLTQVPKGSLESLLSSSLDGTTRALTPEKSAAFLHFIRKMLAWKAEDRASASELLADPWLHTMYDS